MNPEIKAKWIAALPHYKQGRGQLKSGDEFCCLGVLCDIYLQETGGRWTSELDSHELEIWCSKHYLPSQVAEWAGLGRENVNPRIGGDGLAELNDGDKSLGLLPTPFSAIAKLIEEHL